MTTLISNLTTMPQLSATAVRAQLSPLRRSSTREALRARRAGALVRRAAPVSTNPAPRAWLAPAPAVLTDRWWDPHLLDRLQTPLTRYRE